MKSVIELEINAPQEKVAELFDNPQMFPLWMDDVERIEPVRSRTDIAEGPAFRMVTKEGDLEFVGRVVRRDPPHRSRLVLRASNVTVAVKGTFVRVSDLETKLVSEETFSFKGLFGRLFGFLGRRSIHRAHRRQMESFKRFAEQHAA